MKNSATQNPNNKVGRNSGAGPAGISEVVPSEAEQERGLQAFSTERTIQTMGLSRRTLLIGAVTAVGTLMGAGVATYAAQQRRKQHWLKAKISHWI